MPTALLTDSIFLTHNTGMGHPECAARLDFTLRNLCKCSWYSDLVQYSSIPAKTHWINEIHDANYIERIKVDCARGARHIDSPDVVVCLKSYSVAINAVGALLSLSDAVIAKEVDNAFALVRPPGHHAESDMAMGFCLFNSIAIAARYLQKKHKLMRILILDWDVHHGNGTQHIFEKDPSVFYISLHQFPYYPGSGALSETGIDAGMGTTLNCPMSAGSGDMHYKQAFDEIIMPAARNFNPDAILLSAGFDAHHADPLANINLSTQSFIWMTQMMMELATDCCAGRIISVLEGGYNLDALAESVCAHVRVLSGN